MSNLEKVIHAFIFSHLDYYDSLYSDINQKSISIPQLIHNAVVKILNGSGKYFRCLFRFEIDLKNFLISFTAVKAVTMVRTGQSVYCRPLRFI